MNSLCQQLHAKFSKLKATHEELREALQHYDKDGDNSDEVHSASYALKKASKAYESFCQTAYELPDGRAIWLPDYLALVNLTEQNKMDLSSILRRLHEGSINPKSTRLLKLVVEDLKLTSLEDELSPLSNLQELTLSGCRVLSNLGDSLNKLVNLEKLTLFDCTGLSDLGTSLDNLVNLQELVLNGCVSLSHLGRSLSNLVNLRKLYLSDCTGLSDLGESLNNLVNLQELCLSGCKGLTSLGSFVEVLPNLTVDFPGNWTGKPR